MLSRKWITHEQLAFALARQRAAGEGRIGEWLVSTGAIEQDTVARAVAAQWGIPVLSVSHHSLDMVNLVPPLLMDAYDAIPVRVVANRILYLAVEQQVHQSLNRAIEKMTGFRVEPVILPASDYVMLCNSAVRAVSSSGALPDRLFRARSVNNIADAILSLIDETSTFNVQIATVAQYVWVRLLRGDQDGSGESTENVIFTATKP